MTTSQNGWAVDQAGTLQDHSEVAGVTFPNGVRRGDVATVLLYVARRFHAEVEPLVHGWCWGWYVRSVRGSEAVSNHSSGTAIDLNAPSHPLGSVGTFSSAKVRVIRRILNDCKGVVRWGGDYSGRKDEQHFEINANATQVAGLAAWIRETEEGLPVDQATFNKLMTGWAKSSDGVSALAAVWASAWGSGVTRETAGGRLAHIDTMVDVIADRLPAPTPEA